MGTRRRAGLADADRDIALMGSGATVNQFLLQAALKAAQAVIEREDVIRLSPRDWNWLLELTDNPAKPNARLKAAMKLYEKAKRDDAGTSFSWKP